MLEGSDLGGSGNHSEGILSTCIKQGKRQPRNLRPTSPIFWWLFPIHVAIVPSSQPGQCYTGTNTIGPLHQLSHKRSCTLVRTTPAELPPTKDHHLGLHVRLRNVLSTRTRFRWLRRRAFSSVEIGDTGSHDCPESYSFVTVSHEEPKSDTAATVDSFSKAPLRTVTPTTRELSRALGKADRRR